MKEDRQLFLFKSKEPEIPASGYRIKMPVLFS